MPGANWPSYQPFAGLGLGPGMNMAMSMVAPYFTPPGYAMGPMFPSGSLNDSFEAARFQRASTAAGMAAGMPFGGGMGGIQTDINRIGLGAAQGGLIPHWDESQSAQIARQYAPWVSNVNQFMPGFADALGPGFGMWSHAQHSMMDMIRPYMAPMGLPGMGLSGAQAQQRAVGLTQGTYADMFQGQNSFINSRGFGIGDVGGYAQAFSDAGLGPGSSVFTGDLQSAQQRMNAWQRSIVKPMSAVRDLGGAFATMPRAQQIAVMDAITMGGSSRNTMEQQEDYIRTFKHSTRMAGLSEGEGMGLNAMAGARSMEMGGEIGIGAVAGEHARNYGRAAQDLGMDALRYARTSKNEIMQKDAMLTAQAANSQAGDQLNALYAMGEAGMLSGKSLKAFEDLKAGKHKATSMDEFRSMLKADGVDMGAANTIIQGTSRNRALYGDKTADQARASQWELDVKPLMSRSIQGALGSTDAGKAQKGGLDKASLDITEIIKNSVGKSDAEVRQLVKDRLKEGGATEQQAAAGAETALSTASHVTGDILKQGQYGQAALLHNDQVRDKAKAAGDTAAAAGQSDKDRAHEGQSGPLMRLFNAIRKGSGIEEIFASVMGAVPSGEGGDTGSGSGGGSRAGAGGKPDGSEGKPFIVKIKDPVKIEDGVFGDDPGAGGGGDF